MTMARAGAEEVRGGLQLRDDLCFSQAELHATSVSLGSALFEA